MRSEAVEELMQQSRGEEREREKVVTRVRFMSLHRREWRERQKKTKKAKSKYTVTSSELTSQTVDT